MVFDLIAPGWELGELVSSSRRLDNRVDEIIMRRKGTTHHD